MGKKHAPLHRMEKYLQTNKTLTHSERSPHPHLHHIHIYIYARWHQPTCVAVGVVPPLRPCHVTVAGGYITVAVTHLNHP